MSFIAARNRAVAARRSSPVVLYLFVVAVILLAVFNEPLLVSRVQQTSLSSFSIAKKKKPNFRQSRPPPPRDGL